MKIMRPFVQLSLLVAAATCLVACSSVNANLQASNDINPDINGTPSPIAVNVYELSTPEQFSKANFVSLFSEPQSSLGSSLLLVNSFMVAPGTTKDVSMTLKKGVHYVGVVAAYRNINDVDWKQVIAVKDKRVNRFLGIGVDVSIQNSGITLSHTHF